MPTVEEYGRRTHSLAAPAPVYALEITHPDLDSPVRAVADTVPHVIEGADYPVLPFRGLPPKDRTKQAPRGELSIDYVGRELMQWVEASEGGRGAVCRLMKVARPEEGEEGGSVIGWEVTLDVGRVRVNSYALVVSLVPTPVTGRPAVNLRHDPDTSPGLF